MYLATTTDEMEEVIDFADTLKELCNRLNISYTNCKSNINRAFQLKNNKDSKIKKIFIKKVIISED